MPNPPIVPNRPKAPSAPAVRKPRSGVAAKSARPRRRKKAPISGWRLWRERVGRLWRLINGLPASVLTVLVLAILVTGAVTANAVHWAMRKPTELLAPVSGSLMKSPAQTWSAYGDLFQTYSTSAISAYLLAALAQTESNGNWAARTYWRWDLSASDLFGLYRPASSSVGMYQMTEAAFAEAQNHCIRDHVVVAAPAGGAECGYQYALARAVPAQSIELTAVWLDRSVNRLLPARGATANQKRDLAAVIHLCGAGPARTFLRQGFRFARGARCGDHDPAVYLAQVQAMDQTFRRLAAR